MSEAPVRLRPWKRVEYDRLVALGVFQNEPVRDSTAAYGWRYRSVQTLQPPASVAPLALPSVRIPVGLLLP